MLAVLPFLIIFPLTASADICTAFEQVVCENNVKPSEKPPGPPVNLEVQKALDAGAKQLGSRSADEVIEKRLKEKGIELAKGITSKELLGGLLDPQGGPEAISPMLKPEPSCGQRPRNSPQLDQKVRALYASDLSFFFQSHLSANCKQPSGKPDYCGNARDLHREAIELFRARGPNAAVNRKAFVDRYYKAQKDPKKTCSDYIVLSGTQALQVIRQTKEELLTTRSAAEYLYNVYYKSDTHEKLKSAFEDARVSAAGVAERVIEDPAKRSSFIQAYDKLTLSWPNLSAGDYVARADGLGESLKKATGPKIKRYDFKSALADGDPEFFMSPNAIYLDPLAAGKSRSEGAEIIIFPLMLKKFETSPEQIRTVMAHEVGHKLSPEIAELARRSLQNEWKDLLTCFQDPKSIGALPQQSTEVVADFVSAEYLADKLSGLSKDARLSFLKKSLGQFCDWDAQEHARFHLSCDGDHPVTYLRIGGIIGANPRIREAMGCQKPDPKFKTCGLPEGRSIQTQGLTPMRPKAIEAAK